MLSNFKLVFSLTSKNICDVMLPELHPHLNTDYRTSNQENSVYELVHVHTEQD